MLYSLYEVNIKISLNFSLRIAVYMVGGDLSMPMSNLRNRLRVKDKYKYWFPLEDPTPYWEEVELKLKTWSREIFWDKEKKHNPQLILEFLIYALEKAIEYPTSVHTPADSNPAYYVISKIREAHDEGLYFYVIMLMSDKSWRTDLKFQQNLLVILVNMKNGSYIPMDEFSKKRIQKEYYNYVRSYDPTLESYRIFFG
jgi:hypothetical protein